MTNEIETLLRHAPCGIFSCSETGIITSANAYCSNLLEYDPDAFTGTNISAILTIPGRIFYQTHLYPLIKLQQHANEIFLNLSTHSKKVIPVLLNAVVVKSNDRFTIVFSFIEVLNRRKYENDLIQAKKNAEDALNKNESLERIKQELQLQQKELDKKITLLTFQNNELLQLGNIVTHDLQEPLRKLTLFSGELLSGNLKGDRKEDALSVIQRSARRIRTLLLDLQEYLSLSTHNLEITEVDLHKVLQHELREMQALYPHIKVHASIDLLPQVNGNQHQLHLLFHHLLKNAFVHGSIDDSLSLTVKSVLIKDNLFNSLLHKYDYVDYVKITLSDKGRGFDNTYVEYIFEFLKRIHPDSNTSGFGLAFCRKITENHFGEIRAEGNPGAGATFTLILPVNHE